MQDIFDKQIARMDAKLTQHFGHEFSLTLKDGASDTLDAIFDTELDHDSDVKRSLHHTENGFLTVFGTRLDKAKYMGASVTTKLGPRVVHDVLYPDEQTTVLVLNVKTERISGNFIKS